MPGLQQTYDRLVAMRAEARTKRTAILDRCERENRDQLTMSETRAFERLTEQIDDLDERISEASFELKRSGRGDPDVDKLRSATASVTGAGGGQDARSVSRAWAQVAANEIRTQLGGKEGRAVVSGSIDVPSLVIPEVVSIPYPQRVIDLLVNRVPSTYAFEYYKQTARTNAAAPVADLAQKPVSTFTVEAVQDRARVIAHLSEPLPYRIFTSN
jgi:HK97 family phage major capsid protein